MKSWFLLVSFVLLLAAPRAHAQALYRWIDETGKIIIVDDINRIPEIHRERVKIYPSLSGLEEGPPLETREEPEPAVKVPEKAEQTEMSTPLPEEKSARIKALRQKEARLKEKRVRERALQERFKSSSVRSRLYKKRVRQIDEELEAIGEELDEIRPKGQ
jgi:hypothetical protein